MANGALRFPRLSGLIPVRTIVAPHQISTHNVASPRFAPGPFIEQSQNEAISFSAAILVPSTRAVIFAKAVSRLVTISSPNGEKPQSSVVPS